MGPEKPRLVSSAGRTAPLRTIRLDLGFDLFGHHGRHSGWNHLLPGGLRLSDTNCRKSLAQDRFERARIKQALGGGLLGEGVRNRDLDGGHGIYSGNSQIIRGKRGESPPAAPRSASANHDPTVTMWEFLHTDRRTMLGGRLAAAASSWVRCTARSNTKRR